MELFLSHLNAEDISLSTMWPYFLVAILAGLLGGSIGGVLIGAKHMGAQLAALMGAFFGPIAALPGIVIALIIIAFF